MRDKFNTYAVLTDSAKTITVTHTWERTQTFTPSSGVGINVTTGGISVTGTAALAAVTCTTVTATGAVACSSTLAVTGVATIATVASPNNTSLALQGTGTASIDLYTNGVSRVVVSASGHVLAVANNTYDLGQGGNAFRDMTLGRNASIGGTLAVAGAISGTTGTFSSTLQGGATVQAVAGTVTSRLSADSGNGWGTLGTYSNHAFKFVSNSITRGQLTAAGVFELDSITAQSVTVSGGTTAVGALTCTTLAPSGITTLSGTGTTYALDFTGAAGRLRLSNNGSLTVVENDGSTAIMTITESTGGVAFAGAVSGVGATFSGEVRVGSTTALSASATSGFFWMPSMNGTPIGSPTETGDRVAVIYNYSANKVWFYNPTDNTWRGVNVT